LASTPRPSREELRALHRRYKETQDPAERDRIRAQLVDAYHDFVYFLARKFQNRGEPLDDIVQVGYLGLIKAIERFDPDLGFEFTTFATLTVAGEIKRHFRDKGTAIRFPRRLQELHQSVVRVNEEMKNQLGREPTVTELAERLGVPPEDVTEAIEMGPAYMPLSLDQPIGSADGQEGRAIAPDASRAFDHGHEVLRADVAVRDRAAAGDQPDARVTFAARGPGAAPEVRAAGIELTKQHATSRVASAGRTDRAVPSLVPRG
jgi:RNA polymerase sigma-B factor